MHNPSYVGPRQDILRLIPPGVKRVLDVGCSVGTLGLALQERGAEVTGIEIDPSMGAEARERLNEVHIASVEDPVLFERLRERSFDCIIFADLLEHLVDPWTALDRFVERLAPGGVVVASLPDAPVSGLLALSRSRYPRSHAPAFLHPAQHPRAIRFVRSDDQ